MRATKQLERSAAWLAFCLAAAVASVSCRKGAEATEESGADAGVAVQATESSPGDDPPGYVMPPFEKMPVHQLRSIEGEMPVTVIRNGVELMRGKKLGIVRVPTPPARKWVARLGPGMPPERPTLLDTERRKQLAQVEEVMVSIPHHGFAVVIPEEGGHATKLRYDTGEMEEIRATCPADEHPKVRVFAPSDGDPVWLFAEAADGSFWHGPWKDLNDLAPRIEHAHVFRAERTEDGSFDDGLGGMLVASDVHSMKDISCARLHVRADGSFHCHPWSDRVIELANGWRLDQPSATVAPPGSNLAVPLLELDAKLRDLVGEECEAAEEECEAVDEQCEAVAVGAWAEGPTVLAACGEWSQKEAGLFVWWTPGRRLYWNVPLSGCGGIQTTPSAAPMYPMQCYPSQATGWIDIERGLAVEHAPRDGPDLRRAGSVKDLPRLNITPDADSPALYLLDLDRLEERVIDLELPCHAWERGAQLGRRASYSCYEDHRGSSRVLWSEIVDADLHRRFRVQADAPIFDGEDRVIGVLPGQSENRVIRFDLVMPAAK